MESHRQEHQERRPSLTSYRSSESSGVTQDILVAAASLTPEVQPAGQQEELHSGASSSLTSSSARRCGTPLLWAMLLVASVLHVVTRSQAEAAVASHHLRHLAPSSIATIAATASQRRLNVFGDDDRQPVSDPSQSPYSAVGLLRWSDKLSCTASLIGDKFIVTAAECALDADGNVRTSSFAKPRFLPGYAINKAQGTNAQALVVKVHKQSDYWKKWTQNTYVILELDASIGQTYGVLLLPSLADLDQSAGKTEVQLAGYDDKALDLTKATMQYAKCMCYFPSEFNGPQYMLLHDCDTSATGSPGSPLLVRFASLKTYIIGIHSNAIGNVSTATAVDATKPLAFSLDVANHGVLGPFIQKHLESLVASNSSRSDDSGSLDGDGITSATAPVTPKPLPTPKASEDARARIDDGDLNPAAAQPSTGESSSSSSAQANRNERITPAAAYICIAFVCLAWAGILFIAVRYIRRGGAEADEIADDDDDDDPDRIEL